MKIADWKIGTRLGLGFATISLLMLVVAFIGINRLADLNSDIKDIVNDRTPKVAMCNTLLLKLSDVRRITRDMLLDADPAKVKAAVDQIPPISKIISENLDGLEKNLTNERETALFRVIGEVRAKYRDGLNRFIKLSTEGKTDEARQMLYGEMQTTLGAYNQALQNITAYEVSLMDNAGKTAETEYQRSRVIIISLTAAALLMALMIAYFATRSITRPMSEAVKIAQTVAKGDLTSRIDAKSKDETGQLLQALKDMNDNLMQVCSQVRSGTATIAMASSQIAAGNQDLSSRTEQQASSLEETASSMEQLTSTVKQNGDNAQQANQLAISASDIAVKGGVVVSEVVQTMGSINESSRKIVDIISVIDGIAFQTNILALNAAVEAARAGEQGRGFAVVASEVRNLAQRSAGAAKEIKVLIDDSVEKVAAGSKLVDQAGTTMDEIVGSIRRVTDIMGEITAATREQVDGIEQINQAVTDMDSVTQQNAALVEEAAAAAESLQGQANTLVNVVSRFHLGGGVVEAAPAPQLAAQPKRPALEKPATRRTATKVTAASLNAPVRTSVALAGAQGEEWEQF